MKYKSTRGAEKGLSFEDVLFSGKRDRNTAYSISNQPVIVVFVEDRNMMDSILAFEQVKVARPML